MIDLPRLFLGLLKDDDIWFVLRADDCFFDTEWLDVTIHHFTDSIMLRKNRLVVMNYCDNVLLQMILLFVTEHEEQFIIFLNLGSKS